MSMSGMTRWRIGIAIACLFGGIGSAGAQSAAEIIKATIDYWRDISSYSVAEMTIHRPDWQRTMTFRVWTRGEKQSLVRVVAPAKDAGNATLLLGNDMWSFTPKI